MPGAPRVHGVIRRRRWGNPGQRMAARGLGGPGRRPRPLWGWTYVTVANTLWCLGVNWGVRGWDLFLGAKLVLGATGRGQRLADPSGRRPGPGAYFPLSCVCPARPPWCSAQDPVKERGGKAQNSTTSVTAEARCVPCRNLRGRAAMEGASWGLERWARGHDHRSVLPKARPSHQVSVLAAGEVSEWGGSGCLA